MSMSRKDYVALAHALNDAIPTNATEGEMVVWSACCIKVADVCRAMSGAGGFDRDRFLRACRERSK